MKRTFLAVVPDAQTCIAIDRWCALCWPLLQRRVAVQNYHVTLAFLGDTTDKQLQMIDEHLDVRGCAAFKLTLDDLGYWPDSAVLWLAPKLACAEISALAQVAMRVANRAGLRVSRRNYQPHLTLARKAQSVPSAPLMGPDFQCIVESVQLYQSILDRDGVRYRELRSWPLADPAA